MQQSKGLISTSPSENFLTMLQLKKISTNVPDKYHKSKYKDVQQVLIWPEMIEPFRIVKLT
jgi:hypothetical protein